MPRAAIILLLLAGEAAAARPAQISEANLPLRVVVRTAGARIANCIFSLQLIPPHARATTPLASSFSAGDPMYARCYLPDRPGGNRAGELTDVFYLDGKKWWTQAYQEALPSDALERPIALGDVLRTALGTVARGSHKIEVMGTLTRHGRALRLYRGAFRYVR